MHNQYQQNSKVFYNFTIIKKEQHKLSKLLNDPNMSKSITKNWIELNDLSGCQSSVTKNIGFKTPMIRLIWL